MSIDTFAAELLAQVTPPAPELRPPAVYRYLICRTDDGLILDELPLSTTGLPRQIGVDTTASFTLPLDDPRTGAEWPGLVDPRRLPMVVVLRDERPAWAGLIITSRGVEVLELGAVSLEGWLARRVYPTILGGVPIFTGVTFEQVDQLAIARALVTAAKNPLGMNIDGLNPNLEEEPDALSGVFRNRTYTYDQGEDILSILTDLANVQNGFEWTFELDYVPGDTHVSPRFVTGYPMLGIRAPEPEWRFELGVGGVGGNLVDYDVQTDASVGKFATEVVSTGSGEGEARVMSEPARNTDWEDETGLRVMMRTAHSTVKRQSTIDGHAVKDLDIVDRGETISTATTRGDLDPRFGQYHLGDDCRLVVEDTPRHPRQPDGSPGLDVLTRVIGWTLNPETDQVDLELEGVDV